MKPKKVNKKTDSDNESETQVHESSSSNERSDLSKKMYELRKENVILPSDERRYKDWRDILSSHKAVYRY
ncbi:MAG: hypothetical protein F4X92_02510 [Gammaproteobacteria bacterium]|nr:hypothetical protein [Gammaproteobacteria bacterium]